MDRLKHSKSFALVVALLTLFALVVPLGGAALAGHATLDVEPESDVNAPRTTHTMTAFTDAPGIEVNFNIECFPEGDTTSDCSFSNPNAVDPESPNTNDDQDPVFGDPTPSDFECTTGAQADAQGRFSCSVTYTDANSSADNATDHIHAWVDEEAGGGDDMFDDGEVDDWVTKTWEHNPVLNCDPETDTNPTTGEGSSHMITCTVNASSANGGARLSGAQVDSENESGGSVNDPDSNSSRTSPDNGCTTNATGECTITYASESQQGTATIRAWVDLDGDNATDDADGSEDPNEQTNSGTKPEPDNTDAVLKTWAAPASVEAEPTTDTNPVGTEHTVTAFTTQPGVEVNFNIDSGPNSNDDEMEPPLGGATTSDFECTTSNTPVSTNRFSCSWTYEGAGGAGQDNIRVWIDTDEDNDDEWQAGEPFDFVEKDWYTQDPSQARLDCEPESAENPTFGPDADHTITCTVTETQHPDGQPRPFLGAVVQFENESPTINDPDDNSDRTDPDNSCTTSEEPDGNGECSATYESENQAGTATIRAWVEEDEDEATDDADAGEGAGDNDTDGTDVVRKTWIFVEIDASPNSDENPVGGEHTVTAATSDPGVEVHFNIEEGPNSNDDDPPFPAGNPTDSDFTCVTDRDPAGGHTCSWTYEDTGGEGTDSIRVWFDEGEDDDAFQDGEPNDLVTKTWYVQDPNQARLDCFPETGTNPAEGNGSDHQVSCTVLDQRGHPFFEAIVDFENETPNVNDPDNNADRTSPDKTCTTPAGPDGNGQCSVTYESEGEVGTATIRAWVDADDDDSTAEADAQENPGDNDTDNTDVVTKTWTGDARIIDCEPETATNETDQPHTVTCTVTDRGGQRVSGESVTFSEEGSGDISGPRVKNTDQNGQVTVTVVSSTAGTQTITGTITDDLNGNEPNEVDECDKPANNPQGSPAGVCSDSVSKVWEEPDQPQCDDDIDNDGDGRIDHPADPGCSSATDNNEADTTEEPVVERGACAGFPHNSSTPIQGGDGNVVVGSPNDDVLTGTDGDDIICALGGDDAVDALAGQDQVLGGSGNDVIDGGAGKDQLAGHRGNDTISGRGGNDSIVGSGGRDTLKGNGGIDTLRGNDGKDTLQGGSGADTLLGGADDDVLRGGSKSDTLKGGRGNDVMRGGTGRDLCQGGPGRDRSFSCERH